MNLVKQVRYKASNYIKFGISKEFLSSIILVQEFFLSLFYLVLLIYYIIQGLYNSNSFIPFNLYALVIQEGPQVTDSSRVIYFKDSLHKVREVLLVLLLQVNVYKLKVSVLKGFEFNIVVNISYRRKVNSLPLLFLAFINLLTNICHTIQYSAQWEGRGLIRVCKTSQRVRNGLQKGKGIRTGS